LGDRAHLFSKDISLQTHVEDILSVVDMEELSDFVLVGHSYGSFVISGVADTLRERVSRYVYLDGSVPPDMSPGASFSWADFNPPESPEARLKSVREQGNGVALPAPPPSAFAVTKPSRRRLAAASLAAHASRGLYRNLYVQELWEQRIEAHLHRFEQTTLCFARLYS
jgi:pimeloyl-ACP methyl ester carboxylesterase